MKMRNAVMAVVFLIPAGAFAMWQHDTHTTQHSQSNDVQWNQLMASMSNMDLAMASIKPSGDVDVDFVRLMLPHHQAAIDMARTELLYGTDPQMRRLAQEIVTDQQSEVEVMKVWLKRHEDHRTAQPSK